MKNALMWLLLASLALSLLACTSKQEEVITAWEDLATLIEDHGGDCEALAQGLDQLKEDKGQFFTEAVHDDIEKINADEDLRLRMERVYGRLQSADFSCRTNQEVRDALDALVGDLTTLPAS